MESAHVKEVMNIAIKSLYWRLQAWLWGLKWLTVMKVRGVEYAARKFDETEIHGSHRQSRTKKATIGTALAIVIMMSAIMSMSTFRRACCD